MGKWILQAYLTGIDIGDDLRLSLGCFRPLLQQNNLWLLLKKKEKGV